jgi:hypothetical protein
MKNVKFLMMLMLVSLLIGNGCRKDEEIVEISENTSLRNSKMNYYSDLNLPVDHPFSKRPDTGPFVCYSTLPEHSWNGIAVMDMMFRYNHLICISNDSLTKFGTPLWAASIDTSTNDENYTMVPLVDENGDFLSTFTIRKTNFREDFFFVHKSQMTNEENTIFEDIVSLRKKHVTSNCYNFGSSFLDDIFRSFNRIWHKINIDFGEFGGGGTNGIGGYIYTGGFSNSINNIDIYAGGNSGGGASSGVALKYYRPMAGYNVCDPKLRTEEGCKRYFKDYFNIDVNTPELQTKIETCGCFGAVLFVDDEEWNKTNDSRLKCLLCDGNAFLNGNMGQSVDRLFNVLNYVEFPCSNVNTDFLDDFIEENLADVCAKVSMDHNYWPGKIYNDLITELKGLNVDFISRSNNHSGLDAASDNIIMMAALYDLDVNEIKNLSNADLCKKLEAAECLIPKLPSANGYTISDEEIEREKESFWNLIQSDIIDPCTGNKINIDDHILELCEQNKISGSALENLLGEDGVNGLILDPSFKACKKLYCIYKKLYESGDKVFCDNIYNSFNYSQNIDLTLNVGPTHSNADAQVSISPKGNGVVMTFANFNCNSNLNDDINLATHLLHESYHAIFRYKLASNEITETQYRELFRNWVNQKYNKTFTEHELMIKFYMDEIAKSLAKLDGNKYDKSYYMAWIWDGLKQYWPNYFTNEVIESWQVKKQIVLNNNPFKC